MLKPIDFSLNPNLAATSGLVDYPGLALPGPGRFSFTYRVLRQRDRARATASHQPDLPGFAAQSPNSTRLYCGGRLTPGGFKRRRISGKKGCDGANRRSAT